MSQLDPAAYWADLRSRCVQIREAAKRADKALKEPDFREVRRELDIIEQQIQFLRKEIQ
jgi:hypothetical protein